MSNLEYVLLHLLMRLNVSADIQYMMGLLQTHPEYPSMLALSDAISECGIDNVALKIDHGELGSIKTPFIAHFTTNNGEFAIINSINNSSVSISNEWWNNKVISISQFEERCSGAVLVFYPERSSEVISSDEDSDITKIRSQDDISNGDHEPLPWKITYVDIGASYGISEKWKDYVDDSFFKLILVEPDLHEIEKLKKLYPKATIIPCALGDKNAKLNFNKTLSQACSSVLEPDDVQLERFPVKKYFQVVKKTLLDIYRFDDLIEGRNINDPIFLKIDVQGFEFEVLNGFGAILDKVLCLELETHLIPIYKNEKTFFDINTFLNHRGFYLRHLENIGAFEGEMVEFNAYYIKRDVEVKNKMAREMIRFWIELHQIPEAKRCLG